MLLAYLVPANRGRSDERGDIRSHALALKIFEILAERGPADRIFDVGLALDDAPLHLRVPRAHGIAFAHPLQSHALHGFAKPGAVGDQAFLRLAQHVDEAGRDGLAGSIDHSRGTSRLVRPDIDDLVALDRDVADVGRAARAVVDRPAADEHTVADGPRRGRARN